MASAATIGHGSEPVSAAEVEPHLPDAAAGYPSADSGGECGVTVAARFSMPGSGFQANRQYNGSASEVSTFVGVSGNGSGGSSSGSSSSSSSGGGTALAAAQAPRPTPIPAAQTAVETAAEAMVGDAAAAAAAADAGNRKQRRPSNPPFWYSFDYGAVHFVMVSSEHDLHKHSMQYKVRLLAAGTWWQYEPLMCAGASHA